MFVCKRNIDEDQIFYSIYQPYPNVTFNSNLPNPGLCLDGCHIGMTSIHPFFLTSFLLLPKLFSMTMVSAAMWWYLEQGGKGRLAIAITPARTSTTLPPEYRHTSARLRTSCSCSDRDGILQTHTHTVSVTVKLLV